MNSLINLTGILYDKIGKLTKNHEEPLIDSND